MNVDLGWLDDASRRTGQSVLSGGGGNGSDREVDRVYSGCGRYHRPGRPRSSANGRFRYSQTTQHFDTTPMAEAAKRAEPLWPSTRADPAKTEGLQSR